MFWLWLVLAFLGGAVCGAVGLMAWAFDEDSRRAFERVERTSERLNRQLGRHR